jgi:hypothetical protein
MVRKVCADPAVTRFPAVQPTAVGGGAGVGRGVAGAAVGTGRGVTFASPLTVRIQPGSITFGLAASDG